MTNSPRYLRSSIFDLGGQLRELVQDFRSAHTPGSAFDPQALRTLHQQMLRTLAQRSARNRFKRSAVNANPATIHNILTPQQHAQLRQLFAAPVPVTTPQPH